MTVDERRARAVQTLSEHLVDTLSDAIATTGMDEADVASVAVTALVTTAAAFAASRCADAAAAVALIHCVAESAAADIYGAGR